MWIRICRTSGLVQDAGWSHDTRPYNPHSIRDLPTSRDTAATGPQDPSCGPEWIPFFLRQVFPNVLQDSSQKTQHAGRRNVSKKYGSNDPRGRYKAVHLHEVLLLR